MLYGTAASEGIGIGNVIIIEEQSIEYLVHSVTDTEEELTRYRNAVELFCKSTVEQADNLKKTVGNKEAEIPLGHIKMINDPYLNNEIEKLITEGKCAEAALEHMCEMFITMFTSADDELTRQRATDVKDIKNSILKILLGINDVKINNVPKGTVIVAKELTPSMTADINKENVEGIITEDGGFTSHSAILARALEIPAVLNVKDICKKLKNDEKIIVDGCNGIIIPSPDEEQLQSYFYKKEQFIKERRDLDRFRGKVTESADKTKYELFCNIGKSEEAVNAVDADCEGIGLFRTEILFMDRNTVPTEDEQFEAYRKAALILKDKPLIIRTLDIGGDKELPYLGLKKEENPFMGFRAIRYCLKNCDIFKSQLRAILRASAYGQISIMFPLVSDANEFRKAKTLVEEIKTELKNSKIAFDDNIKIGVMIETPAAAVIADILAKEADFFSIGTNDLIGYTMACDRGNSEVSYLYSPLQPSVLRLIKHIAECGKQGNIPVGMCGEAASNDLIIPLLISFGITEFSVSSPAVLKVRKCISSWTKTEADKISEAVMKMSSEKEITEYLKNAI